MTSGEAWLIHENKRLKSELTDATSERDRLAVENRKLWADLATEEAEVQRLTAVVAAATEQARIETAINDELVRQNQELNTRHTQLMDDINGRDEWTKELVRWGQSVPVLNFLHGYLNQCFQIPGASDGSISEECKAEFRKDFAFTQALLEIIEQAEQAGKE